MTENNMLPFEDFANIGRKWANLMRYTNRIAFAIRSDKGWLLQYSFIAFSPFEILTHTAVIETPSIFVGREISAIDQNIAGSIFESTLTDTASICLMGNTYELPGKGQSTIQYYKPMCLPRMAGPQRLPSVLSTRGPSGLLSYPTIESLELELRAHEMPYDNFQELYNDFGIQGSAHDLGGMKSQRTEIILAPPAFLEKVELKAGHLTIGVKASRSINPDRLSISLKLIRIKDHPVERIKIEAGMVWSENKDEIIGSFHKTVPDIGLVQVFLVYDGDFVGSMWARDNSLAFSARSTIHKLIDTNSQFVRKFFDDRNTFEENVTALLSLLNLDCLFYGRIAALKDAPDILAISQQNHLYVVECTTGDINSKGKLRKLYERTNDLRRQLNNSPYQPREILAVVITSILERETLNSSDELRAYGISLVAREGIERLLGQIEAPPLADQLFASALASIPKAVSGAPL